MKNFFFTIMVVAGSACATNAVVIDFDSTVATGTGFAVVGTSYSEDGFTLSLTGPGNMGYWGSDSGQFMGDNPGIGANASKHWYSLTKDGGGTFDIDSIDVMDYFTYEAPSNWGRDITFYGIQADTSVVSSTFTHTTTAYDRETHVFGTDFDNIVAFQWNLNLANAPVDGAEANHIHFVDNIVIADVPEPASIALLGLGGLIMIRRRKSAV